MSTEEVVKSVAKELKYYFQIKRLEDGFDLSDVHQPILSHPPTKASNASGALQGWREIEVRKKLDNYMKHYSFQKRTVPSYYYSHTHGAKPQVTGILHRRKRKQKNFSGGWPILRTVPDQNISKEEAERLVNSATKIICGSEQMRSFGNPSFAYKKENKLSALRLSQNGLSRPTTSISGSSFKDHSATQKKNYHRGRPENSSLSRHSHPRSVSPAQSTKSSASSFRSSSSYSSISSSSSSSFSDDSISKPTPRKNKSPTVINMPEQRQQEEVGVVRSTQTAADNNIGSRTEKHQVGNTEKEEEVEDGPLCEYQVYVCTGDRIGAGTMAPVKLTLYGDNGRTKEFDLNKLSKRHKIPFQKGNEDLFILPAPHVGRLKKIQIGHDRAELNYAWYLDNVTVHDMHAKRIYQFPCERWLSGQGGDKKTYRILPTDREREFMKASDMSKTKSTHDQGDGSMAGISPSKVEQSQKTKSIDDANNLTRSQNDSKNSDDSTRISKLARVESEASKYRQGGAAQRQHIDDYKQEATKVILRSMPGSKVVEEIILENGMNTDNKTKSSNDFINNYKSPNTEHEQNRQSERKREAERLPLNNRSIHDAVKVGDIDQVKHMLDTFPETINLKDKSGWTPLHMAATSGNTDMLRWLVISNADLNAETPTGHTAIHIAAQNGHVNAMMILQAMGASIFSFTKEKQSALHLAAKSGHLECVKWLVANRASLDAKDSSGLTAFRLAEECGHESTASFLNICMQELSNPRSSFAQLRYRRISGSDLPPIKEDTNSGSSGNAWKDDVESDVVKKED